MSFRLAGSSPSGPIQQEPGAHATAAESIGTSGHGEFEVESLLPFGRTTSGATCTYSDSLESRGDPPEDSGHTALFASTSAYQVTSDIACCIFCYSGHPDQRVLDWVSLQDDAGSAEPQQHAQKQFDTLHQKVKGMLACEPLLLATIFGVLLGILAGSLIRLGKPSSKAIDLIGVPA